MINVFPLVYMQTFLILVYYYVQLYKLCILYGKQTKNKVSHGLFIIGVIWTRFIFNFMYPRFAVAFCYFGLTLNIGSLAGDIYLNLFLTGMLEILAYILSFIAIRSPLLGRRITNSSLYILAGLSLLCTLAVPTRE